MKRVLAASAAAVFAVVLAVPAFAGGAHCGDGAKASKTSAAAWGGAYVKRSAAGTFTVVDVAKGSSAAKAGLKSGDIVLAVNGYDLADKADREACASKAACTVGSTVAYKVQRGQSTKTVKVKLEKMPDTATQRYAGRAASFDPGLAAVVMTVAD
jgi:S1-C subfamily serine protease